MMAGDSEQDVGPNGSHTCGGPQHRGQVARQLERARAGQYEHDRPDVRLLVGQKVAVERALCKFVKEGVPDVFGVFVSTLGVPLWLEGKATKYLIDIFFHFLDTPSCPG